MSGLNESIGFAHGLLGTYKPESIRAGVANYRRCLGLYDLGYDRGMTERYRREKHPLNLAWRPAKGESSVICCTCGGLTAVAECTMAAAPAGRGCVFACSPKCECEYELALCSATRAR